jgi:hypothetical protein
MKTVSSWASRRAAGLFWTVWAALVLYVAFAFGPSAFSYVKELLLASFIPGAWQQDHGARDRFIFIKGPLLSRIYAWGSKPASKWWVLGVALVVFAALMVPR